MCEILRRALVADQVLSSSPLEIDDAALDFLATISDGDARSALNGLEMSVAATPLNEDGVKQVSLATVKEAVQRTHLVYDKDGEHYYNMISALHKSIRGSDADASLYWITRMLVSGEV